MAISWTVDITNVNIASKRADATATRRDDVTGATETYNFTQVIIETTAERTALLDLIWAKHLEMVQQQASVDVFVTNLEQLAKSNLEARET